MSIDVDGEVVRKVIAALESPKYKWRTIGGIAKEAGVAPDQVVDVLKSSDVVVRSRVPAKNGDALFTTRPHFRRSASVAEMLRGAFTNRVD